MTERGSKKTPRRGERRPRRAPWIVRFLGGVMGLMVVTLIVLGTVTAASYYTVVHYIRGEEVAVPNVVNRPVAEALEELAGLGLGLQFDESEFSDVVPEGSIIRQRPRPSQAAKVGTPVRVAISRGPAYTAVPQVAGLNEIDAGIVLRANDLEADVISRIYHDAIERDQVITQSPEPGEGLRRGQSVHLLVSMGVEAAVYPAPNLLGLTVPEANERLSRLGCRVGQATERDADAGVVRGTILEQRPAAGAPLAEGTIVDVVTARVVVPLGFRQIP